MHEIAALLSVARNDRLNFETASSHEPHTAMPATLSKADVLKAVEELPDEGIALEDVIERLIVLRKVQAGLEQTGQGLPHAEAVEEFKKPRSERRWNLSRG